MPKTLGNGSRIHIPEFMAHHLLDVTISHVANYAVDAIIFEGRRFHDQGQIKGGTDRQCNILRIVFVHMRRPIDLYRIEAGRPFGLAKIESDRLVRIKYVGSISACVAFG